MPNTQNDLSKAIRFMLVGCVLLTLMDAFAKILGASISVVTIVLARFGLQSLFLLPLVLKGFSPPSLNDALMLLCRAAFIVVATMFFFTAITVMPLADALAIFFIMPLIVTFLSPLFLGEKFGIRRTIAIIIGLIGVMLIVRPSKELFGWYSLMPIGTAFFFGGYLMITRRLGRGNSSDAQGSDLSAIIIQFYTGLFGVFVTLLLVLLLQNNLPQTFTITLPNAREVPFLLGVGALGTFGHLGITAAYKYAPASILAPLQYLELIGAACWGWLLFDDIPTRMTLLGALIIVSSGLYVFYRECATRPPHNRYASAIRR